MDSEKQRLYGQLNRQLTRLVRQFGAMNDNMQTACEHSEAVHTLAINHTALYVTGVAQVIHAA